MEPPAAPAPDLFDQDGVIIANTACRRCGYNLRGLREDGRCPECGTPIGLSTRGDLLRFADPDWVDKLARGVRYMLWGLLVVVVAGGLGGCVLKSGGLPTACVGAFTILAGLLNVYGAWLLTSPDPSRVGEDRLVTARKIVRIGLIAGVLKEVTETLVETLNILPWWVVVFLGIPSVLLGLIGVVGEFAKFLFIEKLANRIPDPKLAAFARFLRWAYCIGLAIMVIGGGLLVIGFFITSGSIGGQTTPPPATAPSTTPSSTSVTATVWGIPFNPSGSPATSQAARTLLPAAMVFGCIALLAMLAFGIMILVLYIQLAGHLRRQAEIARSTWGATIPPSLNPDPPIARPPTPGS